MLLLDEPTNHLGTFSRLDLRCCGLSYKQGDPHTNLGCNKSDAESIQWLEQFLDQFKGTVVCITHDRYFLENVAKWILELDRGEGTLHEVTTPSSTSEFTSCLMILLFH
jgi:sulfate-transporting ATPase